MGDWNAWELHEPGLYDDGVRQREESTVALDLN
jgi:hypothetical protein